jgi:glycosyltransferase involved in cell wall biosynthesis
MDVSVVVPIYNEEDHLPGCIAALRALDYPDDRHEILLVDNNSTDRSAEIVRSHAGVRLLSEPRPGDFAARNRGVAESTGDIVAFTGSDTAPRPDWLQRIVETMRDPDVAVIVGALRFGENRGAMRWLSEYEAEKNRYIFASETPEIYYGYTCNMAVRRSVFETLGPFEEVFRNSDAVLVRRVVDRFGCAAATYGEDVVVRRLEVADLTSYVTKQHTYGRDLWRYGAIADARPLSAGERFEVYRRAVRRGGHGPVAALGLLGVLAVGAASYDLGRLRGAPRGR